MALAAGMGMKKLALVLVPVLLPACFELPSTVDCNLMWSPDQVLVDVTDYRFADGDYVMRFESDSSVECAFSIPLDEDGLFECEGPVDVLIDGTSGGSPNEIVLWDYAPDSFDIELLQDGELIDSASYTPDYAIDEPNGEGCGERRFAEVVF